MKGKRKEPTHVRPLTMKKSSSFLEFWLSNLERDNEIKTDLSETEMKMLQLLILNNELETETNFEDAFNKMTSIDSWLELQNLVNKIADELRLNKGHSIMNNLEHYFKELFQSKHEHSYLPILQHDGLIDMLHHMKFLSEGDRDLQHTLSRVNTKKGEIMMVTDNEFPLDELLHKISDSQLQLLCYCIHLMDDQNSNKITLSIDDYFELREINRQTINVKKLLLDFQVLESIYFTFIANIKGKRKKSHYSRAVTITDVYTRRNKIKCVLGDWTNTLSKEQYSLFNNEFFKYIASKNNPYIVRLSFKLNEIVRNNLKTNQQEFTLNVGRLVQYLGFKEHTIRKKGFTKNCKDRIDNTLDLIAEKEGYTWEYRQIDHATFDEYQKDYIVFRNENLLNAYRKKNKL